jgi:hypothetical protein
MSPEGNETRRSRSRTVRSRFGSRRGSTRTERSSVSAADEMLRAAWSGYRRAAAGPRADWTRGVCQQSRRANAGGRTACPDRGHSARHVGVLLLAMFAAGGLATARAGSWYSRDGPWGSWMANPRRVLRRRSSSAMAFDFTEALICRAQSGSALVQFTLCRLPETGYSCPGRGYHARRRVRENQRLRAKWIV